jgi:hypothetical protein
METGYRTSETGLIEYVNESIDLNRQGAIILEVAVKDQHRPAA